MVRARYEKECCQAYSGVRRELLDDCLCVLGVERVSIEEVQRIDWRSLDDRMKKWIQAVRVLTRVLLNGEWQLCDRVFGDAELIKEVCFTESAKGCVMHLLNFGEAVAIGQRSPEKLFRILDMYDALAQAIPELQALFPEDSRDFVCGEAEGILRALGDAARGTLAEFEKAIQRETTRKALQGGEVHPVSRYVMNYTKLLVDYSETLDSLLDGNVRDGEDRHTGDENSDSYSGSMTPLGQRLRLILSYLEANLEEKSKLYDDGAMQYVFLMNNILYIVTKVKDSELGKLLGDQWVRKRRSQIHQYATGYLRASWTKALSFLKDDGISGSGHSVTKVALKERFKNFNLAYEEIYRSQTAWKVSDPQLREELRISISVKVIPAYRSFMARYAAQLEGRHAGRYIKYTPEDLESHLADLFEGSPAPPSYPRRNSSLGR